MNPFTYKGYGRIYTLTKEDAVKVEELIEELDPFEYDPYYSSGLVTTIDYYPGVVYVGKFELNFDLKEECRKRNIPVFIFDAGFESSPNGYNTHKPATRDEIIAMMRSEPKPEPIKYFKEIRKTASSYSAVTTTAKSISYEVKGNTLEVTLDFGD
jgi:hypothetical protein